MNHWVQQATNGAAKHESVPRVGVKEKGNSNEESTVCFGCNSRRGERLWLRRHRQGQGAPAHRDQGLTSIIYPVAPGLDIVGDHHAGAPTMSAVVVRRAPDDDRAERQ